MLAQSRMIHIAGSDIETPLLVPSISSKAVGPIELGHGHSPGEPVPASQVHTEILLGGIDEALLISAYDIHYKFVADPEAFKSSFRNSPYATPRTLFIDSGWYEKSVGPTSGQWYHEVGEAEAFDYSNYLEVVDSLDSDIEAVLVGWDKPGAYLEQINAAQEFFATRDRFSSDILLKPEGKRRYHNFSDLSLTTAGRLRAFNIVGVTEKELGDTILSRLSALAQLRSRLNDAGVPAPIHVFGGLDPLATPLYFAAGGEIFDGLSWLRYAFRGGVSIHRESISILERNYEKRFAVVINHVQLQNLDAIVELSRELKVFFHNDGDWAKLRQGDVLRPAFDAFESALRRNRGR